MRVVGDERQHDGSAAHGPVASTVERGLLKAALDFYGAAESVIDYHGPDRPQLRWDLHGLQSVREAMGALERRIGLADAAGLSREAIVRVTRLEPELVELIVQRRRDEGDVVGAGVGGAAGGAVGGAVVAIHED